MSRTLLVRAAERALVWIGQVWPRVPNIGLPPVAGTSSTSASASQIITGTNLTGQTLDAGRVVTIDPANAGLIYADCTNEDHGSSVLGVLITSTLPGTTGTAVQAGQLDNLLWTWTPNETLLLGSDGQLVTIANLPAGAVFVRQVAGAVSATRIVIDDEPAIYK